MTGVRERRRAEVRAALLAAGRRELVRAGAAGLSIRAVARDLDMAPSALFRYISGRDELLTLLIVEAYDDLGDTVESAEARVARDDLAGRWRAIATTFRAWAVAHPHEYALLYGSPVPDFHANAEETNRAGTRVTDLLVAIGRDAGTPPPGQEAGPDVAEFVASSDLADLDPRRIVAGITAWTTLVGAVSAELFEQLGPDLPYVTTIFPTAVGLGERLMLGASTTDD